MSIAPPSLSYDRSKLRGMVRHFDVRLDAEKEGGASVGDTALMQVIHYGTSILIPGSTDSALFVLSRTFVAVEALGAMAGVKPDDDPSALDANAGASLPQLVREFVSDISSVGTAKSKNGMAYHLLYARAALVRIAAHFGIDLMAHVREIAHHTHLDH